MLIKRLGVGTQRKRLWKNQMKSWFNGARGVGLVLLIFLCTIRPFDPLPIEALRLKTFDLFQRIAPRLPLTKAPRQVVILDIDEQSLLELGQWPWPRTYLAQMVQNLMDMGAAVVGFDIFFVEPDRMSPKLFAQSVPGLDTRVKKTLEGMPSNDDLFADTISKSRVVLGQTAYQQEILGGTGISQTTPVAILGEDPRPHIWSYQGGVGNIPLLAEAALGLGMVTVIPDSDGVVRRVPGIARDGRRGEALLRAQLPQRLRGGHPQVRGGSDLPDVPSHSPTGR